MIEGFRHISKSLSSDLAEVLSNAGNSSKRSHGDRLSESDSENDEAPARKIPRVASATDNESVDLSIDLLFPEGSETRKESVLSHIYSIISVFFSLPLLRDLLRYSLCLVYARDFSSLFYWTALLAYIMVCTSGTR